MSWRRRDGQGSGDKGTVSRVNAPDMARRCRLAAACGGFFIWTSIAIYRFQSRRLGVRTACAALMPRGN